MTILLLGSWYHSLTLDDSCLCSGGAWHAWTDLSNVELAQKPLVPAQIYVINEAYSLLHGWAEGSIKLADSILEDYFDIPRPWDFPVNDLVQFVQQTNSRECVESDEDTTGGGGDTGGDGGGGGGGGGNSNPALCFTADATVLMANGTYKKIVDVQRGDLVATGIKGAGLVTEKLVHTVQEPTVTTAQLLTKDGLLVGTPSHPIYHQGEWIELGDLESDLLSIQDQAVEAFYNLEIDGHILNDKESSHSYVVNGVIASGLGDHVQLNELYPRQNVWKQKVRS